ncbi:hypothetical protein ACFV4K_00320 [Nocardia sp. NPDC059764]|uniref:hypothetical protein n=1 Tax=Nocardia sp. NPDC059764 TaxID=3346939 RepID=UPI003653508A
MTDYLCPMAAYVATLGGLHDRPGRLRLSSLDITVEAPDIQADNADDHADTEADRGWAR